MRIIPWLVIPAVLFAASAAAEEVTCESKGSGRAECPMDTRGDVRLIRQLSKSPCTEGSTWGVSRHAVWVEGGCRGVFGPGERDDGTVSRPGGGIPLLNAQCPGGLSVHADEGGPVYVNGKQASLKTVNENYFEARDAASGVTISISRNSDGSMSVSYTGRDNANGVCQL